MVIGRIRTVRKREGDDEVTALKKESKTVWLLLLASNHCD